MGGEASKVLQGPTTNCALRSNIKHSLAFGLNELILPMSQSLESLPKFQGLCLLAERHWEIYGTSVLTTVKWRNVYLRHK